MPSNAIDFEKARTSMVDCQIRPNSVTDHEILRAFLTVPREAFVSAAQRPLAYIDEDLPVAAEEDKRFLMEPMSMAKLVQLAAPTQECIILDVGCATGYSTAILSMLSASVVALESDSSLATQAGETLTQLGYDNAVVVSGPLPAGYAKEGPYDVIFVGGAVHEKPTALCDQLKEGGRLVVVEGTGNAGVAKLYTKTGSVIAERNAFNCSIMPLPGFELEETFTF